MKDIVDPLVLDWPSSEDTLQDALRDTLAFWREADRLRDAAETTRYEREPDTIVMSADAHARLFAEPPPFVRRKEAPHGYRIGAKLARRLRR